MFYEELLFIYLVAPPCASARHLTMQSDPQKQCPMGCLKALLSKQNSHTIQSELERLFY